MNPKCLPVGLPTDCAPFGEYPFQPYLIKDEAVVVAGGPSGLFLIMMTEVPVFMCAIPAYVRISGFTVHGSMLYVQDGPVLSCWSTHSWHCVSAINLLDTDLYYSRTTAEPDWAALHKLSATRETTQTALRRAQRKVEWLRLLEATEKQLATPSPARTPEETARLRQLAVDLVDLVGPSRDAVRNDLATAETNAAVMIFSAPVVRTHQLGAKSGAMVYVLRRDGKFHPLDKQLKEMSTAGFDTKVRPSLAIAELNEGRSDNYSCRLYYVAEKGNVRCIDGDAIPPQSLHEWTTKGAVSPDPGVRSRVEGGLVWGSNAQGTGIFALPIASPGAASRVKLPLSQELRWLEIRPEHSLAIVATETSCRLISFAPNTIIADRFAVKPDRAPYFSSFLRELPNEHPLLVAEFERDATRSGGGVAFRLLAANDADVTVPGTPEAYASFYPPLPQAVLGDELEGGGDWGPPVRVRTQPSISLEDAYLMARDKTIQQQLRDLAMDTWATYLARIDQQYGSRANAKTKLGDIALPVLSGRDILYCYAIGAAVTEAHGRRAFELLEDMRDQAKPVRLRFEQITYDVFENRGLVLPMKKEPIRSRTLTLRYDDGRKFDVTTDSEGRTFISRQADGKFLAIEPYTTSDTFIPDFGSRVFITRAGENKLEYHIHKKI